MLANGVLIVAITDGRTEVFNDITEIEDAGEGEWRIGSYRGAPPDTMIVFPDRDDNEE